LDQNRTVLFADVRDSTGLTEQLGDIVSRRLIGTLMEELEATTVAHGGSVIKKIGDEIMAAFEEPRDAARAAIRMQRNLLGRPPVSGVRPQIGIGLNAGPVVMEDGDLFGDVVIVAARLVSNAVATQILTTGDTLAAVGDPDIVSRSLGEHLLKGREEPVDLCEILWRGETALLTAVAPKLSEVPRSSLELRLGTAVLRRTSDAMQPIELGRSEECTLVVPATSSSRKHAKITPRGGRFYLVDHSTNGTYVLQANGDELVVHRDEIMLVGSGHIRLGDPLSEPLGEPGPLDIAFEVKAEG
jgi:adenylate cyclase